jgi:MFS family permease
MVALTFLVSICTSAAVSLPGLLILPMSRELGWGRGEVSGAMGLMFLLFAVTAPFAGALLLRYGLRRMVVTGTALATLCVLGVTRTTEPWHVWLALGVLGLAAGMMALVLSATVVNRWFQERRGLAMGILTAAFAAGQLSFLPAAAALAESQGWRVAVAPAVAGLGLCALLYVLFARDWPADLGLAPFGGVAVVRPATPPAGPAPDSSSARRHTAASAAPGAGRKGNAGARRQTLSPGSTTPERRSSGREAADDDGDDDSSGAGSPSAREKESSSTGCAGPAPSSASMRPVGQASRASSMRTLTLGARRRAGCAASASQALPR